tara:strand:+ start:555 stop:752 length:198 start_codon:yes stop_codon:yes gene_type:complete
MKASSSFGSLFGKLSSSASDLFNQTKETIHPHMETVQEKFNENVKPTVNNAVETVKEKYNNFTKK